VTILLLVPGKPSGIKLHRILPDFGVPVEVLAKREVRILGDFVVVNLIVLDGLPAEDRNRRILPYRFVENEQRAADNIDLTLIKSPP
jgi:hypothetical protein